MPCFATGLLSPPHFAGSPRTEFKGIWVDVQVVLFEGWMLGFEPEDEAAVTAVDPQVSLCLLPLSERILNKVSGCSKLQTAMEDHIQWQYLDWFFFSLAQKTEIKWLDLGELWCVQLVAVNKNLVAYHDAWHKMIDSWVIIQVRDPVWVYTWRQQVQNWISHSILRKLSSCSKIRVCLGALRIQFCCGDSSILSHCSWLLTRRKQQCVLMVGQAWQMNR